jgi:hypothetical protein
MKVESVQNQPQQNVPCKSTITWFGLLEAIAAGADSIGKLMLL